MRPTADLTSSSARDVRAGLHLDAHGRHPGSGHGLDRLDLLQRAGLLLDLDHDRLFDLVGSGSGVGHGHLDGVEWHGRPGLPLEPGKGHDACGQDPEHEQVRRDAVVRHVGDGTAGFSRGVVDLAHRAGDASVRTAMPSVANCTPLTMTSRSSAKAPVT